MQDLIRWAMLQPTPFANRGRPTGEEPQVETAAQFTERFGELFTGLHSGQIVVATARKDVHIHSLGADLDAAAKSFTGIPGGLRRLVVMTPAEIEEFTAQAHGIELRELTAVAA